MIKFTPISLNAVATLILKILSKTLKRITPATFMRRLHPLFLKKNHRKIKIIDNHKSKTLCLINHFYDQDLKALIDYESEYNFIQIEAPQFFNFAKYYFSESVRHLHSPYPGPSDRLRKKYKAVTAKAVSLIINDHCPSAIIAPSDVYYWIREFITCFSDAGIPTLVLDKEGMISPVGFKETSERIKRNAPFMSDAIFTWSERQRRYWHKIGVCNTRIHVVGQMRSDLFSRPNILVPPNKALATFLDQKSDNLITLLSFMDTAYIPEELIRRGHNWRSLKQQSHDIFYSIAAQHTDKKFVIKTHPQQDDFQELQSKYSLPNLLVLNSADCTNYLIAKSHLLIGFQTTTLFEAVNYSKRVIYLGWDPLEHVLKNKILPLRDLSLVTTATSPDDYKMLMDRHVSSKSDRATANVKSSAADSLAEEYLLRPDGKVAERFFQILAANYLNDGS